MTETPRDGLPFPLPERPPVTKVRQVDARTLSAPRAPGEVPHRTQPMAGFEPQFTDIVDYIVRVTDRIWVDRGIGLVYDYYDTSCAIYSHYGVVRSVEEVIASTVVTLHGFPDGEAHYLNVAWSGDEREGFYTSHLGFSRSTNLGPSAYGPATGKRVSLRFCADCISADNRIHTEWLVRDNGALVRQLGLDLHETARTIAETPRMETAVISVPTRMTGQAPPVPLDRPKATMEDWVAHMLHTIWNLRRLDLLADYYAADIVAHSGGGRTVAGLRNLSALIIAIMASAPDATMQLDHVCHSEETDGVIVAARWTLAGTTRAGGLLGVVPGGRPFVMYGMSHWRFAGPKIVEEWTVFDEMGVLAHAYRA